MYVLNNYKKVTAGLKEVRGQDIVNYFERMEYYLTEGFIEKAQLIYGNTCSVGITYRSLKIASKEPVVIHLYSEYDCVDKIAEFSFRLVDLLYAFSFGTAVEIFEA